MMTVDPEPLRRTSSTASSQTADSNVTHASLIPSRSDLSAFLSTTSLIWLSEPLLALVDTAVVGWTQQGADGVLQLAALGLGVTLIDTLLYLTYFVSIATTNQIAVLMTAKDFHKLQVCTSQLLGVAIVCGSIVALVVIFYGTTLLELVAYEADGASPQLVSLAVTYAWMRAAVAPLTVAGLVAQSFCLVTNNTQTVAKAFALAFMINIIGDFILIPKVGIQGAAASTALASCAASLFELRQVYLTLKSWKAKDRIQHEEAYAYMRLQRTETIEDVAALSLPDMESLSNLLKLSLPLAFIMWAEMGSYTALTVRAAEFGAVSLAAQNILMRVFFFLCCLADSLGQAAQTFLPPTIYPKFRKASFFKVLWLLSKIALGAALISSVLARIFLSRIGASLLTKDDFIIGAMEEATLYVSACLFLHPFITVLEGMVIATRDFGKLVRTYCVSILALALMLKYWCEGLDGVWRGLVCWQFSRLFNYIIIRRPEKSDMMAMATHHGAHAGTTAHGVMA